MADLIVGIYGGVDTHKDVHVAAVVDQSGRVLGAESFPANRCGYRRLARWMGCFGPVVVVGVEGTSSYGVGLTGHLLAAGIEVVEVNRPNRQMRHRRGKSDVIDAEAAARAALSGDAVTVPKRNDGIVESIRVTRVALCRRAPIAYASPTNSGISPVNRPGFPGGWSALCSSRSGHLTPGSGVCGAPEVEGVLLREVPDGRAAGFVGDDEVELGLEVRQNRASTPNQCPNRLAVSAHTDRLRR